MPWSIDHKCSNQQTSCTTSLQILKNGQRQELQKAMNLQIGIHPSRILRLENYRIAEKTSKCHFEGKLFSLFQHSQQDLKGL
jgi:hypothetical protein